MMKPDVKQKWVEALRSGEYEQGRFLLAEIKKVNDGEGEGEISYCCLGVLCELAVKEEVVSVERVQVKDMNESVSMKAYDVDTAVLPECVVQWAGLENNNPYIPSRDAGLSNLNDSGLRFSKIADLIEKEL